LKEIFSAIIADFLSCKNHHFVRKLPKKVLVLTVCILSYFYVRTISFVRNLSEKSVKIFDTNVCYFADIHKFREFYYLTEYVKIQNYGAGGTTPTKVFDERKFFRDFFLYIQEHSLKMDKS
jgi:hypothetical protein